MMDDHGVNTWPTGFRIAAAFLALLSLFSSVEGSSPASAAVTMPAAATDYMPGESLTITWDPLDECGTVDIDLYQGRRLVCAIAPGETDDGSFTWVVDDCGLDPACNLRIRVGCGAGRTWSGRFGIEGLLLQQVIPGDRTIDLQWTRIGADTLLATTVADSLVPSVFGGYNVWRRTYDNRLGDARRSRFNKIRTYDVQDIGSDSSAVAWTFPRPVRPLGPVRTQAEDGTVTVERWTVAQTFTVDRPMNICSVRAFFGQVQGSWGVFDTRITTATGGVPNLDNVLARRDTSRTVSPQKWASFVFRDGGADVIPGVEYALVIDAEPNTGSGRLTWAYASYDAFPGGSLSYIVDSDPVWVVDPDSDLAFILGERTLQGCRPALGQRRAGNLDRRFNDSADILAFQRDEDLTLTQFDVPGPYNGFELEYAVTAFFRRRLSSGSIERPSACEDTLFTSDGFPDAVQPSSIAVWPETIFPNSTSPSGSGRLLSRVYPVPNPYVRDPDSASFPRWERPGERRIDFVHVPAGTKIRITTIAAETIRVLEHTEGHGTARWDLENSSGESVSSGIYLWFATAPSGEKKSGQLIIVR